jgi:hypothetical protein
MVKIRDDFVNSATKREAVHDRREVQARSEYVHCGRILTKGQYDAYEEMGALPILGHYVVAPHKVKTLVGDATVQGDAQGRQGDRTRKNKQSVYEPIPLGGASFREALERAQAIRSGDVRGRTSIAFRKSLITRDDMENPRPPRESVRLEMQVERRILNRNERSQSQENVTRYQQRQPGGCVDRCRG